MSVYDFAPHVDVADDVLKLLTPCLGGSQDAAHAALAAIATPTRKARLRINGIRVRIGDSDQNRSLTIAQVVHQAQEELGVDWVIQQDGLVPECLTIAPSASHPSLIERPFIAPEGIEEVCVDRKCAEAVLKGADVFAPGVLATSGGFRSGALAAVFGITDGDSITRGSLLNPARDRLNDARRHYFVGVGVAEMDRDAIALGKGGLAIRVTSRLFPLPSLSSVLRGLAMPQSLPSLLAAHALSPSPSWRVLDMCAAPGAKTTALAALMGDAGCIVACDRSASKVAHIRALCAELGVQSVVAVKRDACAVPPVRGYRTGDGETKGGSGGVGEGSTGARERSGRGRRRPMSEKEEARLERKRRAAAARGMPVPEVVRRAERVGGEEVVVRTEGTEVTDGGAVFGTVGEEGVAVGGREREEGGGSGCGGVGGTEKGKQGQEGCEESQERLREMAEAALVEGGFDAVLLDAPCSAMGLRPRLKQDADLESLVRMATYQRRMIDNAVALLKPGGVLVFSTCTLNPLENECNVAYALRTHRGLVLEDVPDRVRVGGRGVAGTPWVGVLEGDKAKEGRRSGGEGSGGRRIGKRGGEEGEEAGGMGERGPGGEEGAIAGSEFGGCGREAVREVGGLLGVAGERKGGEEEGEGKNRNRADSGTVGSGDAAGSATSLGRWQFGLSDKEAAMVQRFGPGAGGLGDECPGFFIARLRKTQ